MKSLIILVLLFVSMNVYCQNRKAIYGELLGNGFVYSLNYDFAPLANSDKFRVRLGFEYL